MSALEVYVRIVGTLALIGTAGFVLASVGSVLTRLFLTIPELFGVIKEKPCKVCKNEADKANHG